MTLENAPPLSSPGKNTERPARRYREKVVTTPSASQVTLAINPISYFAELTKSVQGSNQLPSNTVVSTETLTDTAAKMIAWPMELWLNTLYRGYEIALAANGITQGASRKLENVVLKNKLTPLPSLWSWPAAASSRKDW